MVYSTINGVEICATFEQGEKFYYIESRGALEQVIFDELVCSLIEAEAGPS